MFFLVKLAKAKPTICEGRPLVVPPPVLRKERFFLLSKHRNIRKLLLSLTIVVSVLLSNNVSTADAENGNGQNSIYLPIVFNGHVNGFSTAEKLLGIYMEQYWTSNTVATYMSRADTIANKKHSVTGWFISLQDVGFTKWQPDKNVNNFYRQLEALWAQGYVSFVNIQSAKEESNYEVTDNCPIPFSAAQVANGQCDQAIGKMADLYKAWVSLGVGRRAFIAPLPEMNGVNADGSIWTSYGGDPANYKSAYQRFIDIFASKGIGRDQVWWVFAPNGWSVTGHEFEKYYPGDGTVDVVGFSSYNYGYCFVANPWQRWENYDTLFEPYISRISNMAPKKPIIIAQTGTTAELQYAGEENVSAKNTWLWENYAFIAKEPQVLGILYYDFNNRTWECNWEITASAKYTGYSEGAALPEFQYLDWQGLESIIP